MKVCTETGEVLHNFSYHGGRCIVPQWYLLCTVPAVLPVLRTPLKTDIPTEICGNQVIGILPAGRMLEVVRK